MYKEPVLRNYMLIKYYLIHNNMPEKFIRETEKIVKISKYFYIEKVGSLYKLYDRKGRLFLEPALRHRVLVKLHDESGHPGISALYGQIKLNFFFEHMYTSIKNYVKNCQLCDQINGKSYEK